MRRALWYLALLTALLCAVPSYAGITNTQLGTGTGTTTAVISLTAGAPIGSLVQVWVNVGTLGIAATSVVDSKLNCTTYTALDNAATASRPTVATFYCVTTVLLSIGDTITVAVPSTDIVTATAFATSGMNAVPADIHAKQVNGASGTTATTTSTGTLGSTYELVVGGIALTATTSAFVPGGGFTSIGGTSGANGSIYTAFQIACTTASVSFTPSWVTSRAYMSNVVSWKFAAADTQCDSKTNAYHVIQFGPPAVESASKVNAYAVLQYASSMSKVNEYAILTPNANANKLPFHVFP